MQNLLIVDPTMPIDAAIQLATLNDCSALLQGIPPVYMAQAETDGWMLPCVITEDDTGAIVSWKPV